MKKLLLTLIAASFVAVGCASAPETTSSTEATPDISSELSNDTMPDMEGMEANSGIGNVEFVMVNPEGAVPMGDAELVVAIKDAETDEPIATENLVAHISMPMDGMEPMLAEANISAGDEPGSYRVKTYLGMEGTWEMHTMVDEGEQQGEATFTFEVQP